MKDYVNDMRAFFRQGIKYEHSRGDMLRLDDARTEKVYYVAEGYIRLYACNNRDEQYTHVIYGPGDVYPISWLASAPFQGLFAEALSDCTIYSVPTAACASAVETDQSIACGMLQQVVLQFRYYARRVTNLEYKYASERLGFRLLTMAERFGEHTDSDVTIIPLLTHHVIGSSINLTRESVSREMEKLTRRGFVSYNKNRQIVVHDPAGLAQYLQVSNPVS